MTEISQYTNQILVSFLRDIEKENSEPIFQISDALPMFFFITLTRPHKSSALIALMRKDQGNQI